MRLRGDFMRLFTLIELIVVVVVLGILSTVVMFNVSDISFDSKKTATQVNEKLLEGAVGSFLAIEGYYPTESQGAVVEDGGELIDFNLLIPKYIKKKPKGDFKINSDESIILLEEDNLPSLPEENALNNKMFDFSNSQINGFNENVYKEQGSPKNIVIPSSINGEVVKSINHLAFREKGLESVKLPARLESIGSMAFMDNKIKEISLPPTLVSILSGAFSNNLLEEVVIPNSVKHMEQLSFAENKIKSVVLPEKYPYSVDNKYAGVEEFAGNQITHLTIPNGWSKLPSEFLLDNIVEEVILPNRSDFVVSIKSKPFQINSKTIIKGPKHLKEGFVDGTYLNDGDKLPSENYITYD